MGLTDTPRGMRLHTAIGGAAGPPRHLEAAEPRRGGKAMGLTDTPRGMRLHTAIGGQQGRPDTSKPPGRGAEGRPWA